MFRQPIEPLETRRLFSAYLVNTTADNIAADGFVSLREAITAANTHAASGDAIAGTGNDSITFAASLRKQTIFLNATQLDITGGLSIDGQNRKVTIDGSGVSRVFGVHSAANVTIANVFIANGFTNGSGGGVLVDGGGSTVLNYVTVLNCTAVGGSGGGVANVGGNLQILNSTLTRNGAVGIDANGGAVSTDSGATSLIYHSLISGNSAQGFGGGVFNAGNTTLDRSTLHDNASYGADRGGGAIANANFLLVSGSLLQNNSTIGDANNHNRGGGGLLNLGGTSFVADTRVKENGSYFGAAGGGLSLYHGTLNIFDSIVTRNLASDGDGGAIGVVETGGGGTLIVSRCTLSYNTARNGDGGGVAVSFGQTTFTNTWIIHNHTEGGFFHGGGISDTGGTVHLFSSRVANNSASGLSGGIDDLSVLDIHDSDVSRNRASGNGGGIGSYGTLTIDDTTINHNTAGQSSGAGGGGVAVFGNSVITNSWLWGNFTTGPGGGIYNAGTLDVLGLSVRFNRASDGGGVFSDSANGAVFTGFDANEYFRNSPNNASGF
jgi:CSLREA domain-containing protein